MLKVWGCIATAHDLRLVALAAVICFTVSLLACKLFSLAMREAKELRLPWLGAAAIVAGSGFCSAHFTAMMSFKPGLAVGYDSLLVSGAFILTILGAGVAFLLLAMAERWAMRALAWACFAAAGGLMHYTALMAFRTQGAIRFDPGYVTVSILITVAIAGGFGVMIPKMLTLRRQAAGALGMTSSIVALHFIGMTGVNIMPDPRIVMPAGLVSQYDLAVMLATAFMMVNGLAVLGVMIHERATTNALARLRDLIEAMPAGLVHYDAEDRMTIWNTHAQQGCLSGLQRTRGMFYAQWLQATVAAGMYEEAKGREAAWMAEHLAARAQPYESRVVEQKCGDRWVRLEQRRTREGGLVSVATDVTDLKLVSERLAQALARAEAADRVKTYVLSNLSHELRTPLNGLVGLTDVLASTDLTAPQRQVVETIFASAQSLTDLIASILDFSALQSGGGGLRSDPFDPAEMVREAASLFAPAALAKGLKLDVDVPDSCGLRVVGDRARLRQVLISLLSNAVKFTEAGGVRVSFSIEDMDARRRLRFAVADTGIGFDGAQAERLFEYFEQGDNSMTRRFGGTGLGLAMSRQIAELMGAALTANSLPGHGATFTFSVILPAAADVPARAAEAGKNTTLDTYAESNLRVLLADDHPTNRQVVEMILSATEAATTSVENGAEALQAFQRGHYDLVLMDLQMPVMDGLTAMKAIRDHEFTAQLPRTPMIALTANVLAEHVAASLAAGADRHLGKPITAARLLEEIGKVFERSAADVADAA